MKLRMPRGFASFLVCSISLVFLYLAGLGIYTQALDIAADLPAYSERINALVSNVSRRMDTFETAVYQTIMPKRLQTPQPQPAPLDANARAKQRRGGAQIQAPPPVPLPPLVQEVHIQQDPKTLFDYAYTYLRQFYDVLLMASFVPFLVYFLLSWRDHLRSRYLYLFQDHHRSSAALAWAGIGDMVRAYVIGNFLLGLLLSVASALLFASVRLPYWLVVAPISGFLSLVPYIGLPLALVPPLVAALPSGQNATIFLFLTISVAMLHLLALNLLYPKIVGARVHLNPLVVTIALMFWGMLWGGIGLLLAIPLTAALKAVCDNVTSLKPYGRLLGD
jgi:predicted PurR-regulated permease PerM